MSSEAKGLTLRSTFKGGGWPFFRIAWSPDSKLLAAPSEDRTIWIWDLEQRQAPHRVATGLPLVTNVAWSADGKFLAYASSEIRIWNRETDSISRFMPGGHESSIWSLAWSKDSKTLASASHDRTIRLWDTTKGVTTRTLQGHSGEVNCIAWSPTKRHLASASNDRTVRIWDLEQGSLHRVLTGHFGGVNCLAWSPTGRSLATASDDRTVMLWNPGSGRQEGILEGHTDSVREVCFSSDGSVVASTGVDGNIIVWSCQTYERVALISTKFNQIHVTGLWMGLAIHPRLPLLAATAENSTALKVWNIDTVALRKAKPTSSSAFYRNAKIALVGDTGVGKSALGFVLNGRRWDSDPGSTHGRRVWLLDNQEAGGEEGSETREVLLWDLAGQPDYRLIHQLHLTELALAMVVFDARSSAEPFVGVRHWDGALKLAQHAQRSSGAPMKKFLVGARVDVGRIGVSEEDIAAFATELGFDKYFLTSAKLNLNIDSLRDAIRESIPWSLLPTGSSTEEFQRIKAFLLVEKQAGHLLYNVDQLCRQYCSANPDFEQASDHRAQFDTCISLLQSRDLIQRLSFGNFILLRPELLDVYAAAFVNAAKDRPDGCLLEEDARKLNFLMDPDERVKDTDQERLLLIATTEELLRHEIALRDGPYLVFPSQLTKIKQDLPGTLSRDTIYQFHGPVANIYATLIVRLSYSGIFKERELWRNTALFRVGYSGACGISLTADDNGAGQITLHFEKESTPQTKYQLDDYVKTHLERWALPDSIVRRRVFRCPECSVELSERQVELRLARGSSSAGCPVCDKPISLVDSAVRIAELGVSLVATIDLAADRMRNRSAARSVIQGKREVGDFDVFMCHNNIDKMQVKSIGEKLIGRGILPWLDIWELRPGFSWVRQLEGQIEKIRSAAVFVGPNGLGPWQEMEIETLLRQFVSRGCAVIPVLLPDLATPRGSRRVRQQFKQKGSGAVTSGGGNTKMSRRPSMKDLVEGVEQRQVPTLPTFLQNLTWVDFRNRMPDPLERLVWGITGKRST